MPTCEFIVGMRKAQERAKIQHEHEWISVNDMLPLCGIPVLVLYRCNWIDVGVYLISDVWKNEKASDPITHWQPLPDPLKDGDR